jgi:hypothetical protein
MRSAYPTEALAIIIGLNAQTTSTGVENLAPDQHATRRRSRNRVVTSNGAQSVASKYVNQAGNLGALAGLVSRGCFGILHDWQSRGATAELARNINNRAMSMIKCSISHSDGLAEDQIVWHLNMLVRILVFAVSCRTLFLSFSSRIECLQRVYLSVSLHDLPSLALDILPFIYSGYREPNEANVCRLSAATG